MDKDMRAEDFDIYIVRSGDSLWKIANIFSIKIDKLININGLINKILKVGQKLFIPKKTKNKYIVKENDTLWSIAKANDITVSELKELNPQLVSDIILVEQEIYIPDKKTVLKSLNNKYVVKEKDTLWNIAKKHNLSVNQLKKINNLSDNTIFINQELIIKDIDNVNYKVKKDDTLWNIATNYGITVDELKKLNELDSDIIKIDQIIKLPNK